MPCALPRHHHILPRHAIFDLCAFMRAPPCAAITLTPRHGKTRYICARLCAIDYHYWLLRMHMPFCRLFLKRRRAALSLRAPLPRARRLFTPHYLNISSCRRFNWLLIRRRRRYASYADGAPPRRACSARWRRCRHAAAIRAAQKFFNMPIRW